MPMTSEQEGPEEEPRASCCKKMVGLGIILFVIFIFFGVHWVIARIIGAIVGRFLAIVLIISAYYFLLRAAITYFAFPGCLKYNQRKLEFQYGQQMASAMGETLSSFKSMIQFFIQHNQSSARAGEDSERESSYYCDAEKTMQFIFECVKIKQMVKTYSSNIDRLRAHEQR